MTVRRLATFQQGALLILVLLNADWQVVDSTRCLGLPYNHNSILRHYTPTQTKSLPDPSLCWNCVVKYFMTSCNTLINKTMWQFTRENSYRGTWIYMDINWRSIISTLSDSATKKTNFLWWYVGFCYRNYVIYKWSWQIYSSVSSPSERGWRMM